MTRINVTPDNRVAVMAFLVCIGAGAGLTALLHYPAPLIVGAIAGVYLLFSIKVIPRGRKWHCCGWADTLGCAGQDCSSSCR